MQSSSLLGHSFLPLLCLRIQVVPLRLLEILPIDLFEEIDQVGERFHALLVVGDVEHDVVEAAPRRTSCLVRDCREKEVKVKAAKDSSQQQVATMVKGMKFSCQTYNAVSSCFSPKPSSLLL